MLLFKVAPRTRRRCEVIIVGGLVGDTRYPPSSLVRRLRRRPPSRGKGAQSQGAQWRSWSFSRRHSRLRAGRSRRSVHFITRILTFRCLLAHRWRYWNDRLALRGTRPFGHLKLCRGSIAHRQPRWDNGTALVVAGLERGHHTGRTTPFELVQGSLTILSIVRFHATQFGFPVRGHRRWGRGKWLMYTGHAKQDARWLQCGESNRSARRRILVHGCAMQGLSTQHLKSLATGRDAELTRMTAASPRSVMECGIQRLSLGFQERLSCQAQSMPRRHGRQSRRGHGALARVASVTALHGT